MLFDDHSHDDGANALATVPTEAPTTERATAVDGEGFLYDVETGEVLGFARIDERFEVDSAEAADWTLEIRSRIEGRIAGLDARKKALLEQIEALRAAELRKLKWWEFRFEPSLIAFARKSLEGGKSRTLQLIHGKVAFRKTTGTNQILDMPAAVAWMLNWAPGKVKTVHTVTVKDVLAAAEQAEADTGEPEPLPWLKSTPPGESASISTGIPVA